MQQTINYSVPVDHAVFLGHFPGDPLVPGALLLQWLADEWFKLTGVALLELKTMKFIKTVRPGDQLKFSYQQNDQAVLCDVFSGEAIVAKAKWVL
jgi:3-hydroxymyristoyl/3-hydroxydecanoyl-(acyl carrier protein) dehydratase